MNLNFGFGLQLMSSSFDDEKPLPNFILFEIFKLYPHDSLITFTDLYYYQPLTIISLLEVMLSFNFSNSPSVDI